MRKNKYLLFFICTFAHLHICTFISAQNKKIDSLQQLLKIDKEDTSKLIHLNKLSKSYNRVGMFDTAKYYCKEAISMSDELQKKASNQIVIKKIGVEKSLAYNFLGNAFAGEGDFTKAMEEYTDALKAAQTVNDTINISFSYNNIGIAYGQLGNYAEALKYQEKSLNLKKAMAHPDLKLMVSNYNNIGEIYFRQGNYAKALENDFASLKIAEQTNDQPSVALCYNNIGNVYCQQKNYAGALEKLNASLKIRETLGDKLQIGNSYNNIGVVYEYQRNFPEALRCYDAALKVRMEIGDQGGIAYSYGNIGNLFLEQANDSAGLRNLLYCLTMERKIGDQGGIVSCCLNIGQVYFSHKNYALAEKYFTEGKSLSLQIGYKEFTRDYYLLFSRLDSTRGDFKSAFENHKMFILYRDSIDNEETRKKTIQTQLTYDFEKKEAVANAEHKKQLENQSALSNEKARKQKIVLLFVVCGLILVVVFAGFIFRSLRVTRKQKVEIENQKHLVEEKQKEILDSIHYAKRIQTSLLPTEKYIDKSLKKLKN